MNNCYICGKSLETKNSIRERIVDGVYVNLCRNCYMFINNRIDPLEEIRENRDKKIDQILDYDKEM